MTKFFYHAGPSLILLAGVMLAALICGFDHRLFAAMLQFVFAISAENPLGDFGVILQAGTCWHHGVNVYVPNACMGGGTYNYSPFLLLVGYLPYSPAELLVSGMAADLAFIAALMMLPAARSKAEFCVRMAAVICPCCLLGIEKANVDVLIFAIIMLALQMASRGGARFLSYILFALLGAAKFYPAALLILLMREPARWLLVAGAVCLAAGTLFMGVYAHDVIVLYNILPAGVPYSYLFGAINLPFGLALQTYSPHLTLAPDVGAIGMTSAPRMVSLGLDVLTAISLVMALRTRRLYQAPLQALPERFLLLLICGAVLITFCYFLAQNVEYRAIFLLLTLPALWNLARRQAGSISRRGRVLLAAILVLLWESLLRNGIAAACLAWLQGEAGIYPQLLFWLLRECIWWWVITQFIAMLMVFAVTQWQRLAPELLALLKARPGKQRKPAPEA